MAYHKRPDKIGNPGPLLDVMRACRQAMVAAAIDVKPMGTFYHGLHMAVAAIDSLATLMIRRPDYFLAQGNAPASKVPPERDCIEPEAD